MPYTASSISPHARRIGQRVREEREKAELSQAELARRAAG
jgi:ribosome-binding protein aMBF1 (putative translation factor)